MNDLEKLITDLSNYWDLSPEKVVDRLNHMNESEIKNVVNKMVKKFQQGGFMRSIGANTGKPINVTGYKFYNDTLDIKPGYKNIRQLFVQEGKTDDGIYDVADVDKGRTIYVRPEGRDTVYFDRPRTFVQGFPVDMARDQEQAKEHWYKWLEWADPKDKEVQKVRKEEWVYKDGGIIKCLKGGKTYTECKKCGGTVEAEKGVKLTRKQAKDLAAKNKGVKGSNFAIAYQNAKNGLRQQGLRGNELRDRARIMVSGISTPSAPLITPKPFVGPVATVNNTFVAERPELLGSKAEYAHERLMRQRANTEIAIENADKFGDAFNIARKAGMLTFKWKGKEYNTRTKDEQDLINKHINAELNSDKTNYNFLMKENIIPIPTYIDVVEEPVYEQPITKQDVREERLRRAMISLGNNLYDID